MSESEIEQQIARSRRRLEKLRERARDEQNGSKSPLDEAIEELGHTLEELSVTLEELASTNEQLAETQIAAEQHARRYLSLFRSAPDAYLVTDQQGVIREANLAVEQKLGHEVRYLIGKPLLPLVAEADRDAFLECLSTLSRGEGRCKDLELRFESKTPFDALVSAVPELRGAETEILWMLHDVTELKERDQFREEIEGQLAPIVWLCEIDPLRPLHLSANYEAIWERSASALGENPRDWLESIHPEDRERIEAAFDRLLQGEPYDVEYRIMLPDGRIRSIHDRGSAFLDRRGRLNRAAGLAEDVTERKAAEAALREAENRRVAAVLSAERAEARERRSLARDLHDALSQSLALAYTKLAGLRDSVADPDARDRLKEIQAIIGEADERTRTLTFRLSPPMLHDLGFSEASEWLAEDLERQFGLRTRVTSDDLPRTLPAAMRETLFRSLRELLINVARHAHTEEAKVSLKSRGGTLEILVEDSGTGFDGGIDSAVGFGLASVRERVEALGGRLEIESERGRGTRARMVVPLPPEA